LSELVEESSSEAPNSSSDTIDYEIHNNDMTMM
jgi:hypothetical protein